MIFLGTDIIQISRIDILIKKYGNKFLNHIFTDIEQDICLNKLKPSIHFSGRFAAKEAVKKAILSSHIHNNISLKSIEIINHISGAPIINKTIKSIDKSKIILSISHCNKYATSTALFQV